MFFEDKTLKKNKNYNSIKLNVKSNFKNKKLSHYKEFKDAVKTFNKMRLYLKKL